MAQSKRMVNNQTSQHEFLNPNKYLSRLGISQCVKEILQLSLPIDHPVDALNTDVFSFSF